MIKKSGDNLEVFNQRSSFLTVFLLLAFAIIIVRLFYLQIINGKNSQKLAEAQHKIYKQLLPSRGQIELADISGEFQSFPLAANLKSYLVYAVPQDITNESLTASSLASVLNMDSAEILTKISDKKKKYVPLKKKLSEEEQEKIKSLNLSGIFFDSEDARFYPANNMLSQTIGFVGYKNNGTEKVGLYGLERYFQDQLAGQKGSLEGQKDSFGEQIFGVENNNKPAVDGLNLILTVDKSIQFQAQSIIKEAVETNLADSGSLIVADPKTGKILALANYPDFNPNEFNKVEDPSVFNNDAVTGNYEPGSTFKALTMAAALDSGSITPETTYTDNGFIEVDGYKIKNAEPEPRGVQNMKDVLNYSLNTGVIFALNKMGNQEFFKYVKAFGFGKKTGIELPETAGNLANLNTNIKVNYYTASFGQGITATPMQMVQAYTALANNGVMMKPYIVASKIYADGSIENTKPQEVGRVITKKTASQVTAMLVDDVEIGYGKKSAVPGYYMAGKTGTSQVARKDGRAGYEDLDNIGSFLGYGPAEDPRFVMLVRVNHPRTVKYAETTAAPAWGKMAQFLVNYLHIPPTRQVTGAK